MSNQDAGDKNPCVVVDSGANFDCVPKEWFVPSGVKQIETKSLTGVSVQEFNELGDCLQNDKNLQIASLVKLVNDTGCEMKFSKEGVVLKDKNGTIVPVSVINNIPQIPRRKYVELILPGLREQTHKSNALIAKIKALEKYVDAGGLYTPDQTCLTMTRLSDHDASV